MSRAYGNIKAVSIGDPFILPTSGVCKGVRIGERVRVMVIIMNVHAAGRKTRIGTRGETRQNGFL